MGTTVGTGVSVSLADKSFPSWALQARTRNQSQEKQERLIGEISRGLAGELSAREAEELRCISRENNLEIFRKNLFVFGRRVEDAGNEALAVQVFRALQSEAPQSEGTEITQLASARLSALTGRGGSFGNQVEVFFRRFREKVPTTALTLMPGWLAFKTVRLVAWNGLLSQAVGSAFMRRVGAPILASLVGIGAEAPIITMLQERALGHPMSSEGLAANYRLMLGMRGAGGIATMLTRLPGVPGVLARLLPQAGVLGGIYMTQAPDLSLSQALLTLADFHVSGALAARFLGTPFAARERALDQASFRPSPTSRAGSPRWAQAIAGPVEPVMRSWTPEPTHLRVNMFKQLVVSGEGGEGSSPPKMIPIPGGKFSMGSKDLKDAQPVREVEVSPFLLGETPVTNAQYNQYVETRQENPFVLLQTSDETGLTSVVDVGTDPETLLPRNYRGVLSHWNPSEPFIRGGLTLLKIVEPKVPYGFSGPNQPVVMVNWYEAMAYAALVVRGGRLPTEAEWEYAARGPQGFEYGTRSGALTREEAHYDADGTVDVGSYPPNAYGLYDMTGNVWEWIRDRYSANEYTTRRRKDPTGPSYGLQVVQRGGSWFETEPKFLRATYRDRNYPHFRYYYFGFRVAAPDPQKTALPLAARGT